MEMTLRWYGSKFDTVTLQQIKQIPGVTGVITTLYDTQPGEVWSQERIHALKEEVEAAGLRISGIESVNIHEDIKLGKPSREQLIANYIETLENLGKEDQEQSWQESFRTAPQHWLTHRRQSTSSFPRRCSSPSQAT